MSDQPDLNFIARQMERMIRDQAATRDDIRVLTAMVMRLDGSMGTVLEELRAVHGR